VNIQVEAGNGNVEGNVLAWQRKCGGLMIVVGGVAYMMQSFLFYNLNNHPELNPETKEMYFLPTCIVRRAHLVGPPHCYQSSNTKN